MNLDLTGYIITLRLKIQYDAMLFYINGILSEMTRISLDLIDQNFTLDGKVFFSHFLTVLNALAYEYFLATLKSTVSRIN